MYSRMMLGLAIGLFVASVACGQTWDGGGTTNNWTDGANWNTNVAPVSNGTATITFAGVTRLAPIMNGFYDVNRLRFDETAAAFNLVSSTGQVLTLRGGGITNDSPGVTQTISVGVIVAAPQTWEGVGSFVVNPVALGANLLTIDSTATISMNSTVSGSGRIIKNGTGAVVLSSSNSFSGGITLNDGTLAIGHNGGLGTSALTIHGGSFEGAGGARTLANAVVVNGDFAIPGGTAVNFTGPISITGNRKLTNGIANLTISGVIGADAPDHELSLGGSGNLLISGSGLTLGASLKLDSGTLTATGLINTAGHTFTQDGGTFTGSLINRGTFNFNGGTPTGNFANEAGAVATINANLTLAAALNNFGTLRVGDSRTLNIAAQQFTNSGAVELLGGTISANASTLLANPGVISGFGTITTTDTSFGNAGRINISGGNLTLASNVAFSNSGTVSVPAGRQMIWNSAASFGNTGLVQLAGGTIAGTGAVSNNGAGEIRGGGRVQVALTNAGGIVRATAGEALTIVNLVVNNAGGEIRVDDAATMNVQNTFNSSGTIVVGGPSAALNLNAMTNTGTLRGQGRVTGAAFNNGIVRAEGGTLTFASAGNTNTAAGRLEAGSGTQLFYTQGMAANAGLIALTGGAFDNNNVAFSNPGRIEGYGTLRAGGITNTGTISVGGALDVLGAVTNNGTVSSSTGSTVRFFGPVNGPGNYTGSGTVTFLNTFSPGASPASVSFGGDLALTGASGLVIELGGVTPGSQYDTLAIGGSATVGGELDVDLLGGFVPTIGSQFQIVSATGGVEGKFSTALLPSLAGASWQLQYSANAVLLRVALSGDFDFSGKVDAADYTLWRNSLGQTGAALAADANGNGQIDANDFGAWKSHFGQSVLLGGGSLAAVPEPASSLLLAICLGIAFLPQRHFISRCGR